MRSRDSRPFTRADLPDLLAFVSSNAKARLPRSMYLMTSDVAWRLPGSAPGQNLRLWYDDAGLAGYVWFEPTTGMELDLRADLGYGDRISNDMLAWSEARRRDFEPARPRFVDLGSMTEWEEEVLHPRPAGADDGLCLTTVAFEGDRERIAFLEERGYRATKHFTPDYRRSLDVALPESRLGPGMRLRHVTDRDLEERVATHRDSWIGSSYDRARHASVCASDVFDPELDIVLETADGSFASYCICWTDSVLGIGSFEPVGTRPAWRGRGVGREVIYEGLRRLKAKGMHSARVGTAGFNEPSQGLYQSCGFELVDTCRTFMKTLTA
jgi:ribosomal protein S18 acetylase RimI-like enzyme